MIIDGQQILIPDFNSQSGTWHTQKATVRQGGENWFHIEKEDGTILWGSQSEDIQNMIDRAADIERQDTH